jgi:hypothetical protein
LNVKGDYLKKLLEFQAIGERLNGASNASSGTQSARNSFKVLPRVFASAELHAKTKLGEETH